MSSPRSPTRPHSLRRRQSMKVLELERKVEQLSEKNRVLIEDKEKIEKYVKLSLRTSLNDKDTEINALKHTISSLQEEVSRSTKLSRSLNKPNSVVARQNLERNTVDEDHHTKVLQELKQARDALHRLNINMQNEIKHVISTKDNDIAGLRAELNTANQKIQETQKQLLLSKEIDKEYLNLKDDSYFENACQRLCQHVQHWVLRFSKSSDVKSCKLMSEIDDESIIERLDNTILDGIDVDIYLSNRVKRRDVLMSMVMTMISEFIFTRYLFGMDRDERQKLKYLEKTLLEVGPAPAVHSWRAITLSLLSKRLAFIQQRDEDIEAVVAVILETLSEILPPPTNIKKQIEEQLTRVIREAACLAIDMRCQKAEYIMLPHKQPEYDSNCKIKSKILFDAAHMNECSDDSESKIFLEDSQAVVRIVLFPLIVRKCDTGESNKDIVIWPAQVLVAKSAKLIFDDDDIHSKFSSKSNIPSVQNE